MAEDESRVGPVVVDLKTAAAPWRVNGQRAAESVLALLGASLGRLWAAGPSNRAVVVQQAAPVLSSRTRCLKQPACQGQKSGRVG